MSFKVKHTVKALLMNYSKELKTQGRTQQILRFDPKIPIFFFFRRGQTHIFSQWSQDIVSLQKWILMCQGSCYVRMNMDEQIQQSAAEMQ